MKDLLVDPPHHTLTVSIAQAYDVYELDKEARVFGRLRRPDLTGYARASGLSSAAAASSSNHVSAPWTGATP
jgi:hypothetical protein